MVAAIQPAVERGAHLVVLPQHVGLTLLGAAGVRDDPVPVLQKKAAVLLKAFEETCAGLACGSACGWCPVRRLSPAPMVNRSWRRRTCSRRMAASPARQTQTHLGAREKAWGLARGDSLDVFETPLGRIGLIVGEDMRYPEVARILTLQGASILIHVAALPAPFDEEAWLASLWREVQGNQVFGVEACLVGDCFGQAYAGRSAILAPVEMTEGERGRLGAIRSRPMASKSSPPSWISMRSKRLWTAITFFDISTMTCTRANFQRRIAPLPRITQSPLIPFIHAHSRNSRRRGSSEVCCLTFYG